MQHTHKGFARTVFNSELDKYVSSLFKMKCILCSCPSWTPIRPRFSFQASLCKESEEETGCLTGPRWFAAFGHQQDTSVLPREDLTLAHHGGIPSQRTWEVPWRPQPTAAAIARPQGLLQAGTGTLLVPKHQVTDEHGAATALISVQQQEAADNISRRSPVSKCHHFSVPERGWGRPTPLRCYLQQGQVPGRARGAQAPRKEVSSCLHL